MKKIIIFYVVIVCSLSLSSQELKEVFLKDNNVPIPIYSNQVGDKIAYTIMSDTVFENYYSISIIEENEIMFYAEIKSASQYNSPVIEGWIDKKHCGVYLKEKHDKNNGILLYEKTELESKFKIIKYNVSVPVTVVSIYKKWLKVILEEDGNIYVGWVNLYCSNIYNSCS